MALPNLKIGDNCWKIVEADTAWILLDAHAYYSNLYDNLCRAQKRIIFLGWDFDSRLELLRFNDGRTHGRPTRFGKLLKHLAKELPHVEVYILAWDFATLYLPMREMFQKLKFNALGSNIKFYFDGQHPLGSSHHQKIVVIDESIAFCGGLDITSHRWDTSEHKAENPLRQDHGHHFAPFHDVMVAVTGPAAKELAKIASERLTRATGRDLPELTTGPRATGFNCIDEFRNIQIAISRTIPVFKEYEEVREVETLFLDQIKCAETYIYIENQYLTAPAIIKAFEKRLATETCPSILIVLPKTQSDPISKLVMGTLTSEAIKCLQAADRYQKLFIGYPYDPYLPKNQYENVHSKVVSIDDEQIRIGSANLNNRSMGLDTECDLTLLTDNDPKTRQKFRQETARMISNHFDCDGPEVLRIWEGSDLDFRTLNRKLALSNSRSLKEFELNSNGTSTLTRAGIKVLDSPSPLEKAADNLLAKGFENHVGDFYRVVPVGLISTTIFSFIFALLSPGFELRQIDIPALMFQSSEANLWLIAIMSFALGGILALPFPLLVIGWLSHLGWRATPFLIIGVLVASATGYGVGRMIGERPKRLPGRWLPMVNEKLTQGRFWSHFWSRFFPFAPFGIVSLISGRNSLNFLPFMLGGLAGIIPYLVSVTILHLQLLKCFNDPSLSNIMILLVQAAPVLYLIKLVQRRFAIRISKTNQDNNLSYLHKL